MADTSGGINWQDILGAITAAGVPIIGKTISGNGTSAASQPGGLAAAGGMPPEVTQLLQQSVGRQQYQNPLFQAVTNQAFMGLPTYARQGLSLGSSIPSGAPAGGGSPTTGGGGLSPLAAGAIGGAAGGAASSIDFGKLIAALKKLFGGGDASVQGDKPQAGGTGLPSFGTSPLDPFAGWADQPVDQGPQFNIPSDPGVWWDKQTGGGASPTDPSGGTGVGPGMQEYWNLYGSP